MKFNEIKLVPFAFYALYLFVRMPVYINKYGIKIRMLKEIVVVASRKGNQFKDKGWDCDIGTKG